MNHNPSLSFPICKIKLASVTGIVDCARQLLGTNTGLTGTPQQRRLASRVRAESRELGGEPRTPHPPRSLPAPPRSAEVICRRREAWRAPKPAAAAMASVVEYRGLKAGYYCGYCESREGKASRGECPAVQVAGTTSRQARPPSWQVSGAERGRRSPDSLPVVPLVFPQPVSFPISVFPPHPHRRQPPLTEEERK